LRRRVRLREWLERRGERAARRGRRGEDPPARRFGLPAAHAPVLVDRDDVRFGAYRAIDVVRARCPIWSMRSATAPLPRRWPGSRRAGGRQSRGIPDLPGQRVAARDPRSRPPAARPTAGAGGRPGLRAGVVEHRDRTRLPTGHGARFRPRCRGDRVRRQARELDRLLALLETERLGAGAPDEDKLWSAAESRGKV